MRGAARAHKAMFEQQLTTVGVTVRVIMAPARSGDTTMAARVFGAPGFETADGETHEVLVVWSNGHTANGVFDDGIDGAPSRVSATLARNGQRLDGIIRCRLSDVILDPQKPQGKTLFHVAKEVEYQGQRFSVTGFSMAGLPPEGPYILWAGLSRIDKE